MSKTRRLSLGWVIGTIVVVELVVLYVLLQGNSWVYDDNFFLVLAGQEGFDWHWLTSTQFQHWDIAMHAAYSLQHRLFFFDYRWALVAMLCFLAGSMYLLERVVALLVRSPWIAITAMAWFGINILWIRPLQWWAAGVQYFPYTFFDLLCLYAYLRFHASGSSRWACVSGGALIAGLLFYEKPAYMLVYLALLRILLLSNDLRPRALLRDFWSERQAWVLYLVIVAIWGIGYLHSGAYSSSSLGHVSAGEYVSYFRILWLQTLVPSLASVTIPAENLDFLQILFVIAAQLAVLGAFVVSVKRRRSAWRAWAFLLIVVAIGGALVARSRIAQFGVDIANDPRYLIDFAWLVPLALCGAFARSSKLTPVVASNRERVATPAPRLGVALGCIALLVYAGGSIASAAAVQRGWPGPHSRTWEQNLRRDFATVKRTDAQPVIADNVTPFEIMEPFVSPYNRLSRVLRMYVGPVQVDGPLNGPLFDVAEDGRVHAAKLIPTAPGSVQRVTDARELTVNGGREVHRGSELCLIADSAEIHVERRLPTAPTVGDAPYYMLLTYQVWHPVGLPIFVNAGSGYPGTTDHSIELQPGATRSIGWLGPDSPRSLLFSIPPQNTVCLGRIDVVTVRNN